MRVLLMVGLVTAISCKQEHTAPATSPTVESPPDERDALWTLAPEGTTLGVVTSAHGVAMLEGALLAIQERLASRKELSVLHSELMQALQSTIGSPNPTLTSLGLTADRGFALFLAGDDPQVIVLPIGDRDRFVAAVHGSRGADDDDNVRGWLCRTIEGHYVCARHRELLSTLGHGGLDVVRRTSAYRGELEVAARGTDGLRVAAVAALERGSIVVHGTIGGMSRSALDRLASPARPRSESETAAAFGIIDLAPMFALAPPIPIVPGITLREFTRSISGPITYVLRAGTNDMGIRVPLNDPEPTRTIIAHCAALASVIGRPTLLRDGACGLPFPGYDFTLEGWLDGKELQVGDRAAGRSFMLTPSRLARELAHDEWSAALYGRGSYFNQRHAIPPALSQPTDVMQLLQTLLPLVVELGLGIRKDGLDVHFVAGARSIWSYSSEVAQRLLAISPDSVLSGDAIERCESIATNAPNSVFAQDFRATPTGTAGIVIVSTFAAGMFPDVGKTVIGRPRSSLP